ncbi:hypothetical protein PENTCL1PPCAC_13131, partial [Pristionchus entomophagus]
ESPISEMSGYLPVEEPMEEDDEKQDKVVKVVKKKQKNIQEEAEKLRRSKEDSQLEELKAKADLLKIKADKAVKIHQNAGYNYENECKRVVQRRAAYDSRTKNKKNIIDQGKRLKKLHESERGRRQAEKEELDIVRAKYNT